MAKAADDRQDPFGICVVAAAHVHAEPDHGFAGALRIGFIDDSFARSGEFAAFAALLPGAFVGAFALAGRALGTLASLGGAASIKQLFRGGQACAIHAHQGAGDLFRSAISHQHLGERQIFFRAWLGEDRVFLHALLVGEAYFFGGRRVAPQHVDARLCDQAFRFAALGVGHQQDANALAASAACAPAAMKERVAIVRQFGVDDKLDAWQINAARSHVGRHANAGAPVAQGLQRMSALALRIFARQRDGGKTALQQTCMQMAHRFARLAEDDGAARFKIAQHVDTRMLDLIGRDANGAIVDIAMRLALIDSVDAERVVLVAARKVGDIARDGGGE